MPFLSFTRLLLKISFCLFCLMHASNLLYATDLCCCVDRQRLMKKNDTLIKELDQTLSLFKALLSKIEGKQSKAKEANKPEELKSKRQTKLDYSFVGSFDSEESLYPSTLYSRIQHLRHAVATLDRKENHLPEPVIDSMLDILQNQKFPEASIDEDRRSQIQSLSTSSTLNGVIQVLTNDVAAEAAWEDEIRYLLKQSTQQSKYLSLDANLPDLVNSLFKRLFLEWRNKVIYKEDSNDDQNIFSLLYKLQNIINDPIKTPAHPLDILIGSMDDEDPNTLFGKAILTQKIVLNSVISKFTPIHYEQLYSLLDDSQDSVMTALNDTIRYVSGESSTKPTKSIETCFDEIHLLFKKVLIERLMILPDKTERNKNSLENLMKKISDNLILIESNSPQLTLLKQYFFKPTPNYRDQNELYYNQYSLFARIKSILNILMHPQYLLDYTVFEEWNALIGHETDTCQNTGIGLLKACLNEVNTKSSDRLDIALSYIGNPHDVFTLNEEKHSFYGIINRLFRLSFQQLLGFIQPDKDRSLPALMEKFSERFKDSPQLAAMIGTSEDSIESVTLCGRMNLLCNSIHQLIKDNQFDWADLVIQSLYKEIPEIQRKLQYGIDLPQYDLWKYFGKAWWSDHEIYKPLNNLIHVVLGGGIHQAFSYPNTKAILQPNTLENYIDLINENLEKTHNITGALRAVIGDKIPNGIHLEKVSTLQNRFYYLHEIIKKLPIFLNYENAQALYKLVSDPDKGLLMKFDALNDLLVNLNILNQRSQSFTQAQKAQIDNLINKARLIIGKNTDQPGMETIASIMNAFFERSSTIFFNLILNKFTASKFGFELENKHSLYDDVLKFQQFLNKNSNPNVNETWGLIGNNWHNKYTPSIFGRLAAIQDILLNLWNESYYIPFDKILEIAAQFHEKINDIMHNSWTPYSVMNVGTPISFIEENSLFGNLNHMIDASLTVSLKRSFTSILETLTEIQQKILQTMSLDHAQKDELIALTGDPSTEKLYAYLSEISKAFDPIAGFLRLHQTKQLLSTNKKIENLLDDLNNYLQEIYNKCSIPAEEIIDAVQHHIGGSMDVIDRAPETVFSLANNLAIRLYCMYCTLNEWMDDRNFLNTFNYLNAIKQEFFPGDCQLFYLSYNLKQLHHLFNEINDNVELSIRQILSSEGVIKWDGGLEEAVLAFHQLKDPIQQIERMLPSVLASSKGELARCSDMSEYIVDIVSLFSQFRYKMLKGLGRMLYHAQDESDDPRKWNCKEVSLSIQDIAGDFHYQNNIIHLLANHIDPLLQHLEQVAPFINMIQKFKDAIVQIIPPLQSIQKDIRSHANAHRTFHCLHCNVKTVASAWEAMTGEIEELKMNMESLISALVRKCEETLFRQSYDELHTFFDPDKASWMRLFPVSYESDGLPSISSTGEIQFQPNSVPHRIVEMKKFLSNIMMFTMNQTYQDHEESCVADYSVAPCIEDFQTDSLNGSNDAEG